MFHQFGDENFRQNAVRLLEDALDNWKELSRIWAGHYMPYQMGRVNQIFGYSYYVEDAKRDIEIARCMQPDDDDEAEVMAQAGITSEPWAGVYGK